MLMITSEIKITETLSPTLDSREAATTLVAIIKEESKINHKIEIDFTGVVFISRSFADQFHKDLYADEEKLDLNFKKASLDIISMLRAASNAQTQRKTAVNTYKEFVFNNLSKSGDITFSW